MCSSGAEAFGGRSGHTFNHRRRRARAIALSIIAREAEGYLVSRAKFLDRTEWDGGNPHMSAQAHSPAALLLDEPRAGHNGTVLHPVALSERATELHPTHDVAEVRRALRTRYVDDLSSDARIALTTRAHRRAHRHAGAQRAIDITIALVAIALTAPVMLAVAIAVRLTSRGPVLFRQTRLGQHGTTFKCLKFRTMVQNAEEVLEQLLSSDPEAMGTFAQVYKLPVDPRVTPLGKFLRTCSLDELPQLFNVLRGEMSIVGPRPLVPQELWRYGSFAAVLLQARPGMTGPWQIGGRSNLPYGERIELDVEYVLNRSLWRDLWITATTLPKLALARDAH